MEGVANMEKPEVLVVDDQPENLLLMSRVLNRPDISIIKARSGKEALEISEGRDLALAILDIQMPEMSGLELAEAFRASGKFTSTPIIFITAMSGQDAYMFKGYEAGAVDYLFKPVMPQIIRSKVAVFIELHKQRKLIQEQSKLLEDKIRALSAANKSLQDALEQIKTLKGIIPICASCKKIRTDDGAWEQIERYIEKHSDAGFSHGICPECLKKQFPDMADDILGKV